MVELCGVARPRGQGPAADKHGRDLRVSLSGRWEGNCVLPQEENAAIGGASAAGESF